MEHTKVKDKWNAPIVCLIIFIIVILVLIVQLGYLSLSKNVYGIDMKQFAKNRNTVALSLIANRGTIYDVNGDTLAQNISSYTLIAHLDPNRTTNELDPQHVVDKEYTASKLATILGEEHYEYILKRLNDSAKQVEFGTVGKNLTELTKLAIEDLSLPGISFTETIKRYYPNGNFASYIVGYAKQYNRINIKVRKTFDLYTLYKNYYDNYKDITIDISNPDVVRLEDTLLVGMIKGNSFITIKSSEGILANVLVNVSDYDVYNEVDSTIVGELGIESKFNDILVGTDGYVKYQQDKYGYKIPDTPEERKEAIDGYDIYLTIDSNIQRFAENAVKEINDNYSPKFTVVAVMDAKTGDILASATTPDFNPNSIPNDMSYQNPLVSYSYEPGSVMKTYTYMCAIEKGVYNGSKEYKTGEYVFDDETVIHDWHHAGWGYLTYDNGFSYSSNLAIINIIKDYLTRDELRDCFEKYGFGKKTGIELSSEAAGSIKFKYETEIMSAGFGQGISTTPVQQLQALSIIANDGTMVRPHIIKKIVNTETNEVTETKEEKIENVASKSTIAKIKDLMASVINPDSPTGYRYYLEGYDIIGKTGTAQIFEGKGYLTGANDYIVSIGLMYPKDDPKIIIYIAAKQPTDANLALPNATKELIKNISKYIGLFDTKEKELSIIHETYNYINEDVSKAKEELINIKMKPIVIGDGNKIVNQYPKVGFSIIENDKVFLVTNGSNKVMPNIINWAKSDVAVLCDLLNIKCNYEGHGFVIEQSINEGEIITKNSTLNVKLESNKN